MNSIVLKILVDLVKQLVTAALYEFIDHAVRNAEADSAGIRGETKRKMVMASVENLEAYKSVAGWAINLAIETAVARLRLQ